MNTSRNSTLLIPNKNLADRRLLRCFSAIVALLVLIGGFLPAIAEAQMQSSTSGNPQSIRLGEAIVVPGTAEALVPV